MDSVEKFNRPAVFKIIREIKTMLQYAVASGKKLPDWILPAIAPIEVKQIHYEKSSSGSSVDFPFDTKELSQINKIYTTLAAAVSPATPMSIDYTTPSKKMFFVLGTKTIPVIRNMWIMSILFLTGFVITGFYLDNIYYVQANLLFSSGLGAYFYSLYTANKYVVNRSFDPTYITFYYNRIIIGIIAGIILSNLIVPPQSNGSLNINTSIISMLGGFSSDAVLKILNRLVSMLITLVQGDAKEILEIREAELKTRFLEKQAKMKIETASRLLAMLNDIQSKTDDESFLRIKSVVDKILGEEAEQI